MHNYGIGVALENLMVTAMPVATATRFEFLHILIIDDNPHMRSLIKQVLRSFEVRSIREATNGDEGLLVLRAFHPDLVIVRMEAEPLGGIALSKRIRGCSGNIDRTVPIILISGDRTRGTVLAARDAGINEFLLHPICAAGLRSRVQSVIDKPRPFVAAAAYCGPCRRRRRLEYEGPDRRTGEPDPFADPLLSQEEINALMQPEVAIA